MEFLITTIVLGFVSWMLGVITEKGAYQVAAALFLAAAVIFLVCLVSII